MYELCIGGLGVSYLNKSNVGSFRLATRLGVEAQ